MVKQLTVSQLAAQCRLEAERYKQTQESDETYCFELFRRALVEQDKGAWEAIYQQYYLLISAWVHRHSRFSETGEEADFFINEAFSRFWRFASKPETAGQLVNLNKCLYYLKTCVGCVISDHFRREEKDALKRAIPLEDGNQAIPEALIQVETLVELRQALWQVVQNEMERIVAEESWVYGYTPSQIQARHPEKFATVEAVTRVKHNIFRRLRRKLMGDQ